MNDHELLLSAFVDGEPVDAVALGEALRRPGAVDFLVDLAAMRQRLRASTDRPSDAFYLNWQRHSTFESPARRRWRRLAGIGAVAAGLMLAVTAGFWMGASARGVAEPAGPPTPTRVIDFAPDPEFRSIDLREGRLP